MEKKMKTTEEKQEEHSSLSPMACKLLEQSISGGSVPKLKQEEKRSGEANIVVVDEGDEAQQARAPSDVLAFARSVQHVDSSLE